MLICQWEQVSSLHQVVVGLTNGGEITRCSVGPGACSSDDIARCAHASFQNLEAFCGGEQRELLGAGHGCWSRERKKGPSTAPTCYRHQRLAKHLRRRGDFPSFGQSGRSRHTPNFLFEVMDRLGALCARRSDGLCGFKLYLWKNETVEEGNKHLYWEKKLH